MGFKERDVAEVPLTEAEADLIEASSGHASSSMVPKVGPLLLVGCALLAIAGGTGYAFRTLGSDPVVAELRGSVGLAAVRVPKLLPVSKGLEKFPKLCDTKIVAETCSILNSDTKEFFETAADANVHILHASELAEAIAVDRHEIAAFLKSIGAANAEVDKEALEKGAYAVKCKDLCSKVVASFADAVLPAKSDVACYSDPKSGKKMCNLDVSPHKVKKEGKAERTHVHVNTSMRESSLSKVPHHTDGKVASLDALKYPKAGDTIMRLMIAQMFRIHPLSGATYGRQVANTSMAVQNVSSKAPKSGAQAPKSSANVSKVDQKVEGRRLSNMGNDNTCEYARDKECDDGTYCSHGTDCDDCKNCHKNVDTCQYARDGACDGAEFCQMGTDCTDCHNCDGSAPQWGPEPDLDFDYTSDWNYNDPATSDPAPAPAPGFDYTADWNNNDPATSDPAPAPAPGRAPAPAPGPVPPQEVMPLTASQVRRAVENLATAQAWAALAMRKINTADATSLLDTWLGNHLPATRQEVKIVARSVITVLSNPIFVSNENECLKQEGTVAFVYPGEKRNGQFIITLCEFAKNVARKEFLGTLYHEAAHHPSARRDDVIYGRSECKGLASRQPRSAMDNADSHEYFFEDLNTA